MSLVGQFPGVNDAKRRVIRAPQNPLDFSTIVSIYPRDIIEVKHTIQPGIFRLNAGTYDKPSLLIVGSSSWWREIDEDQPLLEIPQSSIQIADSVVKDYCNGLLAYSIDSMPGLFYMPGKFTIEEIKKSYKHELDSALTKQKNWYSMLTRLADSLWARSNGNPLVISEDMKVAAKELGQDKDWLKNFQASELTRCPACGSLRNPQFPICPTCKNIDDAHPSSKGLKFAQ